MDRLAADEQRPMALNFDDYTVYYHTLILYTAASDLGTIWNKRSCLLTPHAINMHLHLAMNNHSHVLLQLVGFTSSTTSGR